MGKPEDVLRFWYGVFEPFSKVTFANQALWYKKDPIFDAQIKTLFESDLHRAIRNELDPWAEESPAHGVALIVLLDQFTRNMYRDTPQMYAYDAKALSISLKLIEKRWDQNLPFPMRENVYLPLEHSEDRDMQRRNVEFATAMVDSAPEDSKAMVSLYLRYAQAHFEVVDRFGRFPHRNLILGRISTPEEEEFLKTNPGF